VAEKYGQMLSYIDGVRRPEVAPGRDHVYHLYVIRTEKRDALRKYLTDAGISTVLSYPKALPFYPAYVYLGHKPEDFPVAYANQSRILSLPIFPEMRDEMIFYVVDCVREFFES
jgi:dTDP-4-amino-4,6-dideoxygalactose transaminase